MAESIRGGRFLGAGAVLGFWLSAYYLIRLKILGQSGIINAQSKNNDTLMRKAHPPEWAYITGCPAGIPESSDFTDREGTMEKYFIILLLYILVSSPISNKNQIFKNITGNTMDSYNISDNNYKDQDVDISYPSIEGMRDILLQKKINKQLMTESVRELQKFRINGLDAKDLYLRINYKISYQSSNFLSVIYEGDVYLKGAPYPRSTFTTINIDLDSGERLALCDMVNIDSDFIQNVKNTLRFYGENNKEHRVIYERTLEYSDDDFTDVFMGADMASGSDCYSYFTDESLGLRFSTSHNAGDYYVIEIKLDNMKEAVK